MCTIKVMGITVTTGPRWVEFPGCDRDAELRFSALDANIRSWAGIAAAATAAMVELIAEAAGTRLWAKCGYPTLQQWVALRCGISSAHAKRLIAMAEALDGLPQVRERFTAGAVSEDHVHEITKAGVTAFHDDEAAGLAEQMTVGQLRKALSFLPAAPDRPIPEPPAEPPDRPPEREEQEWVRYGHTASGRWELHASCTAERGALFERALEAARDREYRDRNGRPADLADPPEAVTNVDALVRMASDTLDIADPATSRGGLPGERYLVNVHLHDHGDGRLHLGPRLPASTTSELCCDAQIRSWIHHPDGSVGLGRRARVVSPRLRAVIEDRDGGCRVPGCEQTRHLHIHHIIHWVDGGHTNPDNLICLCGQHHRDVHHGRIVITGNPDDATLAVGRADGTVFEVGHPSAPTRQTLNDATGPIARTPARDGEKCQWKWVDWRPPRPPRLPQRPPDTPRTYRWPTIDPNTIWPGN